MILLPSHSPSVKSVACNGGSPGGCWEGEIPMEQLRKLPSVFAFLISDNNRLTLHWSIVVWY